MGLSDRDYMRHDYDEDQGQEPPPRRRILIAIVALLVVAGLVLRVILPILG